MSRPAAAVHRVIKAYDVRGLVGEEIDEQFVCRGRRCVRPADARRGRRAGGDRLRHAGQLTVAGGGVRRRRGRAGPRRGADRPGLHRSAVFRLRPAGLPRRDVHRQPQPGRLQRHQAVPGGRQARRQGHRADRDQRGGHRRRARPRRAARRRCADRDVLADYGEFLRSLVESGRAAAAAGRRRRGQRDGRPHHSRGAGTDSVDHAAAAVLRTRRHVPQPRGQSAGPGEPRRPAGARASRPAPTSGWPSTATPTAASSSTNRGSRSRRQR